MSVINRTVKRTKDHKFNVNAFPSSYFETKRILRRDHCQFIVFRPTFLSRRFPRNLCVAFLVAPINRCFLGILPFVLCVQDDGRPIISEVCDIQKTTYDTVFIDVRLLKTFVENAREIARLGDHVNAFKRLATVVSEMYLLRPGRGSWVRFAIV